MLDEITVGGEIETRGYVGSTEIGRHLTRRVIGMFLLLWINHIRNSSTIVTTKIPRSILDQLRKHQTTTDAKAIHISCRRQLHELHIPYERKMRVLIDSVITYCNVSKSKGNHPVFVTEDVQRARAVIS